MKNIAQNAAREYTMVTPNAILKMAAISDNNDHR